VKNLIEELKVPRDTLQKLERVKTKREGPRPIKITVTQEEEKFKLLANSVKFSKVNIGPDRTPNQQKACQILVEELKERRKKGEKDITIRGTKIVTMPKG